MSIDIDTARRIAGLARIDVPETALPGIAADLSAFLAWVDQLAEVAVDGVEPMTSVTPMALKMRADVVSDGDMRDAVLANAPAAQAGFFVVPKVVE